MNLQKGKEIFFAYYGNKEAILREKGEEYSACKVSALQESKWSEQFSREFICKRKLESGKQMVQVIRESLSLFTNEDAVNLLLKLIYDQTVDTYSRILFCQMAYDYLGRINEDLQEKIYSAVCDIRFFEGKRNLTVDPSYYSSESGANALRRKIWKKLKEMSRIKNATKKNIKMTVYTGYISAWFIFLPIAFFLAYVQAQIVVQSKSEVFLSGSVILFLMLGILYLLTAHNLSFATFTRSGFVLKFLWFTVSRVRWSQVQKISIEVDPIVGTLVDDLFPGAPSTGKVFAFSAFQGQKVFGIIWAAYRRKSPWFMNRIKRVEKAIRKFAPSKIIDF